MNWMNCKYTSQVALKFTDVVCTALSQRGWKVYCRQHKKRKQEEMQFIKGNRKHAGGYSSGGGLTSRGPTIEGNILVYICHVCR